MGAPTAILYMLVAGVILAPVSCTAPSPHAQPPAVVADTEAAFSILPLHALDIGAQHARTVAIFLTGDGGWAPFDRNICADLARAGVPTVGFDTGEYFSQLREPEIASQALARTIEAAMHRWGADRVIVIGYSFGADVAPFLVNRLQPALRARIDRVALMSPSDQAPFQVTLAERAGLDVPGARPVIPELTSLTNSGVRVACLHGERDHAAVCPSVSLPLMKSIPLRGGHGLGDDHQAVADAILAAWPIEPG